MSKPSFWQRITHKPDVESTLNADHQLARTLTTRDLIALGIGAVIGTGIFILPGTVAATTSGPAITLAFVLAAVVCSLAAMCYAEFASALPVAGSAYAYGSIVFGQLVGWVIGWALILEYMLAVAVVSTSFSAYFASLISGFGLHLPQAISGAFDPAHGTYINLIAVLVILLIGSMLSRGMNTSMAVNRAMVLVKLLIIGIFVVVGAFYIKPVNWHPFMPFGVKGILAGASLVFFAYLGFDAVSASAPEVKKAAEDPAARHHWHLDHRHHPVCAGRNRFNRHGEVHAPQRGRSGVVRAELHPPAAARRHHCSRRTGGHVHNDGHHDLL